MIAGIVYFHGMDSVSSEKKNEFRGLLSRKSTKNFYEVDFGNAFFVRCNADAISKDSGIVENEEFVSFLAGEPIFSDENIYNSQFELAKSLKNRNFKFIERSRGVYCSVAYWIDEENLPNIALCADKLGIRPLYYYVCSEYLIFSTALRVIEDLSFVPKSVNDVSLLQVIGFGFSLGDSTQYKNIFLLNPAEVIYFKKNIIEKEKYWDWNNVNPLDSKDNESILAEAYDIFKQSIRLRLHDDSKVVSYLSGGMDSRAIVSVLSNLEISTFAFNFSPSGSQDLEYAKEYAEKESNVVFYTSPRDYDVGYNFRCELVDSLSEKVKTECDGFRRPRSVWSGDGGSVGVGCVYLDKSIIELLSDKKIDESIYRYFKINNIKLPLNIMKMSSEHYRPDFLFESVRNEIKNYSCDDKQKIYMFLMLNDQRRHLHDFYENLDLHGIEYQLPFFDSKFLEFIFSIPIEYRINHIFYTDWFNYFSEAVRKVPWQTYRGHLPCPIEKTRELKYQWEKNRSFREKVSRSISVGVDGIRLSFSNEGLGFISKNKLFIRSVAHLLGFKDCAYAVRSASIYHDSVRHCNPSD